MTEAAAPPTIVRMRHIRQALMCASGARAFCARHGIDWWRFLAEGVPAEVVEATGDAMALQVVAAAREEARGAK